mgnify:CR=1 FL=1
MEMVNYFMDIFFLPSLFVHAAHKGHCGSMHIPVGECAWVATAECRKSISYFYGEKHVDHTHTINDNQQRTLYPESLLGYKGGAQLSLTQVEFMTERPVLRGEV